MSPLSKTWMVSVLAMCIGADWAAAVAPIANDQSVSSAPPVERRRVSLSWSDTDGGSMSWILVTPPSLGTLEYRTWYSDQYYPVPTNTPLSDYAYDWYYSASQTTTGSDSFAWCVTDGTSTSRVATVTILMTATNTPVIANDGAASLVVGAVRYPFYPSITDPDAQPRLFQMVVPPGRGLVEYPSGSDYLPVTTDLLVRASGLVYTPSGVSTGSDAIVWRACDGASTSAPATFTFTLGSNTVPVANDQTSGDIVTNRVRVELGLYWSDPDSCQRVSCALVRAPAHMTLEWSSNDTYIAVTTNTAVAAGQSWYVTPSPGYVGSDNFQWRVLDGVATSRTATFSFNLVTNHPPVADNLSGLCMSGSNTSVLVRYTDIDPSQVFTSRVVRSAAHGSVEVTNLWNGMGLLYTPDAGFTGIDTFSYKVNDGLDDSNEARVRIQVRGLGDRAGNLVVLAVNQSLYPNISNAVERLRTDLIDEGYTSKVIQVSNTASASNLWAALKAEQASTNQWLTGAILIGNLPKPTANSEYSDLVYWNMTRYDTVTKYITSFDIWVSRIYATGLAYGNEVDLILRALDANHACRKGFSRLPHTAYYYNAWNYYAEQDLYGQRLLNAWPSLRATNEISGDGRATSKKFFPGRTDINEAGADALIGGGDFFFESSHGASYCYMNGLFVTDDLFRLLAQQRVVIADSCSVGPYGGIMNCHLFTRGGGCVLSLGKTVELYIGEYDLANNWPGRPEFIGRLGAGETWGDALLWDYCLSRTAAVWYGDLSLRARAAPSNSVPLMTPVAVSPAMPVAGQPVTFSVSVSDVDGAQTNGSPLGFRAQIEWFVNNYNTGKGTPTFTTNDTGAGWTNFTYTFPSGGVYTVRAEVMDAWQARSWRELSVTVTNLMATNGTPVSWMLNRGLALDGTYTTWDALALGDQDHDGVPTWAEYFAGTNPNNATSRLCIVSGAFSNGFPILKWFGTTNAQNGYTVQWTSNLLNGMGWMSVTGNLPRLEGTNAITLPEAPFAPVYLRVTVPK
jgi:hypothetical protein